MGGPNLLRSQVALSDQEGELIVPIIEGSRQSAGMPAIPMGPDDAKAVAAYIRTVEATIGRQGTPPAVGKAVPSVLVGDAREGKAYFTAKCASCHDGGNSLQGIATRISDPKALQNYWVTAGGRGGRRAGGAPPGETSSARTVTATVTLASGEKIEGRLVRVDDFVVAIELKDGTARSFRRVGGAVTVDIHDPMKVHRDLLSVYTDKDMHDVTA
jgi:cytochrome c oxidase cbb3-type subunit 3